MGRSDQKVTSLFRTNLVRRANEVSSRICSSSSEFPRTGETNESNNVKMGIVNTKGQAQPIMCGRSKMKTKTILLQFRSSWLGHRLSNLGPRSITPIATDWWNDAGNYGFLMSVRDSLGGFICWFCMAITENQLFLLKNVLKKNHFFLLGPRVTLRTKWDFHFVLGPLFAL